MWMRLYYSAAAAHDLMPDELADKIGGYTPNVTRARFADRASYGDKGTIGRGGVCVGRKPALSPFAAAGWRAGRSVILSTAASFRVGRCD